MDYEYSNHNFMVNKLSLDSPLHKDCYSYEEIQSPFIFLTLLSLKIDSAKELTFLLL